MTYKNSWKEYRILNALAYLTVPLLVGALYLNELLSMTHPAIILIASTAINLLLLLRVMMWACPKCNSKSNGFFGSPLKNKACRVCGLKKFEIPQDRRG